jgi:hypothetical protein
MLSSTVCRFEHFQTEWYRTLARRLQVDRVDLPEDDPGRNLHRKGWEFCAISQVLAERGMLCSGRRGLGFAVGQEPLPALFAAYGASILATDLQLEESSEGWVNSGQHAASVEVLYKSSLIDRKAFDSLVTFRPADMRTLEGFVPNSFDFLWSSCAFEHLGTLQRGIDFVLASTDLLRPGGIAVHTTEYNISSNGDTLAAGQDVLYRRRDIEELDRRLRLKSCGCEAVDFNPGTHPYDLDFDRPPYYSTGRKHIKLECRGYVCTSILLVIQKGTFADSQSA